MKIRLYKPRLKDEKKLGREPFAILSYNDIQLEVDYTIFRGLALDLEFWLWDKTKQKFNSFKRVVLRKMVKDVNKKGDKNE